MGEFFGDEDKKVKKVEKELISDPRVLLATFDMLKSKIQLLRDEGYESIMPVRIKLVGARKTADDTGQVGELRSRMESSKITKLTIGMTMWNALENIEDLNKWSERYIEYTDKHIESLIFVVDSAFEIITRLYKEMGTIRKQQALQPLNSAASPLKRRYTLPRPMPLYGVPEEEPPAPNEVPEEAEQEETHGSPFSEPPALPQSTERPKSLKVDVYQSMIGEKTEMYKEAVKGGDDRKIHEARRHMLGICGTSEEKKRRVIEIMRRIDLEIQMKKSDSSEAGGKPESGPGTN